MREHAPILSAPGEEEESYLIMICMGSLQIFWFWRYSFFRLHIRSSAK
jgi:hypothetical protein